MAYTPYQDGTQAFGIPDSPLTIPTGGGGVVYIAEDIQLQYPSNRAEIKDPNGIPTGQVLMPQVITGSAKLQLATSATAIPARNMLFTMQGATWIVETVGTAYTQGAYTYANITFVQKIN